MKQTLDQKMKGTNNMPKKYKHRDEAELRTTGDKSGKNQESKKLPNAKCIKRYRASFEKKLALPKDCEISIGRKLTSGKKAEST